MILPMLLAETDNLQIVTRRNSLAFVSRVWLKKFSVAFVLSNNKFRIFV